MQIPRSKRFTKTGALLLCGAAIGGAGGYAASASGASSTPSTTASSPHAHHHQGSRARAAKRTGLRGVEARLRHAVSASLVVPDGQGQFATVSLVRGTLVSSSDESLTVREGTARYSYKTVTVSLPADTVVRLSHARSSLSALSAGDRVLVIQGPKRTLVAARPGA